MTVVEGFGWAYLIAFAIWLVLRVFWFDTHWLLALLNDSTLYWFAPLLVFLPYAALRQNYALLLALLVPCVVFLIFYGARFLPRAPANEPAAHTDFRVMSFNMHYGNWNHDAFAQTILNAQPEIVGLQEVSPENRKVIEARLAQQYPHRVFQAINEKHAVALLSRYPFTNVEFLTPTIERGLRATVQLPGANVTIIVAHLAPPNMLTYPLTQFVPLARNRFETRRAETELLQRIGATESDPAVLLCDCNLSDTSKTYRTLAVTWRDSFRERGWGLGHTLKFFLPVPLQRYDYVWHNDALRVSNFHIGPDGGSDHLPVMAILHPS